MQMARNTILSAAVRSALTASAIAAVGFSSYAVAQDQELEEIIVTGSLIPMDVNAPGVPVTLMTTEDIQATGVSTDLLDVLQKSQPYFYGATNIGSENGNISSGSTNGGSQVALRNRATLVLVNGRRVAVNPVAASGGYYFTDVSMIPVSAVERIEVLADGASATYGADAVGGVVNIILKTDYDGLEVGARYGSDGAGDYTERSYYATMGASGEKTNVTFSTEWKKSDPLYQYQRSWAQPCCTPSFAGSVNVGTSYYLLNPDLNAPGQGLDLTPAQLVAAGVYSGPRSQTEQTAFFDLSEKPTMLIAAERRSFLVAVDHEINEHLTLFGDYLNSQTETISQLNAQPVNTRIAADNINNPFNVAVTARNRFVDFPRVYQTENFAQHGVVGLRGDLIGTWKFELAGNWNRTVSKFRNDGLVDTRAYLFHVDNPQYGFNPFAREQPMDVMLGNDDFPGLIGTAFYDYESSLYGADIRFYGEVWDLPAGAIKLAFGADRRKEALSFVNDYNDRNGLWLGATPTKPFAADLEVSGYFAELRIPVFSEDFNVPGFYGLELSMAGRQEVYDTTDDPFVPKFTMRWLPFGETLAVRGTYSESFTAPSLYELYGPSGVGFTSPIVLERYDSAGNPILDANGNPVTTAQLQFRGRGGSNPELDPSTAKNWTAGVVWTPEGALQGLEISLDWFDIEEEDLIGSVGSDLIAQDVEQYGPASAYANLVRLGESLAGELYFDNGDPVTSPGQMSTLPSDTIWITSANVNLVTVEQSGLDVKVGYVFETEGFGTFSAQVTGVYLNEYSVQDLPTNDPTDYAGTFSGVTIYPDWRTFTQIGWTMGGWSVGLNHSYVPSVTDITSDDYDVDSYSQFDIRVAFDFSAITENNGTRVAFGINNVLDEDPPYIPGEGNQGADIAAYDPIGAFYYGEISYKF